MPGAQLAFLGFCLFSHFALMRLKVRQGAEIGAERSFSFKSGFPPLAWAVATTAICSATIRLALRSCSATLTNFGRFLGMRPALL